MCRAKLLAFFICTLAAVGKPTNAADVATIGKAQKPLPKDTEIARDPWLVASSGIEVADNEEVVGDDEEEFDGIPLKYLDAITTKILTDPVYVLEKKKVEQQNFNRSTLLNCLAGKDCEKHPFTRIPFTKREILSNNLLKNSVEKFFEVKNRLDEYAAAVLVESEALSEKGTLAIDIDEEDSERTSLRSGYEQSTRAGGRCCKLLFLCLNCTVIFFIVYSCFGLRRY